MLTNSWLNKHNNNPDKSCCCHRRWGNQNGLSTIFTTFIGLARTVYIHRIWPYIWWFPCQNYRLYTVYVWFWPTLDISHAFITVFTIIIHHHKQSCVFVPGGETTAASPPLWRHVPCIPHNFHHHKQSCVSVPGGETTAASPPLWRHVPCIPCNFHHHKQSCVVVIAGGETTTASPPLWWHVPCIHHGLHHHNHGRLDGHHVPPAKGMQCSPHSFLVQFFYGSFNRQRITSGQNKRLRKGTGKN